MSKHIASARMTIPQIRARKGGEKIVALTAYTAPVAAILDEHADLLLVGDSVGMVVHGLPSTVGVTLDMMILHGQAVMRASTRALVVVDLPFGSYESDPATAYRSAARVMQETGCQAVKVEACAGVAEIIGFLAGRGIPVIGHVGLRPQAVNVDGGFKSKGRTADERQRVLAEAQAADRAGAFAIVVEGGWRRWPTRSPARSARPRPASAPRADATAKSSSPTTCSACSSGRPSSSAATATCGA